jgi:hypothetical protein
MAGGDTGRDRGIVFRDWKGGSRADLQGEIPQNFVLTEG